MRKHTKIDFSDHVILEKTINKWRNIIGVDPVYIIQFIESTIDNGFPAWIEGLEIENPHPVVNIIINSEWLQKNKYNEKDVTEIIIHELIHIILFDAFIVINPDYKYEGIRGRATELLTMKIAGALMKCIQITN